MSMSAKLEVDLQAAQDAVTKQGDIVRSLKASAKDGKAEKARALSMATFLLQS